MFRELLVGLFLNYFFYLFYFYLNETNCLEVLKVAGFIEITEEIEGNQENFLQYPFEASVEILSTLKDALLDQSIDREIKVSFFKK